MGKRKVKPRPGRLKAMAQGWGGEKTVLAGSAREKKMKKSAGKKTESKESNKNFRTDKRQI